MKTSNTRALDYISRNGWLDSSARRALAASCADLLTRIALLFSDGGPHLPWSPERAVYIGRDVVSAFGDYYAREVRSLRQWSIMRAAACVLAERADVWLHDPLLAMLPRTPTPPVTPIF